MDRKCDSCFFNIPKTECIGCAAQKLRWAFEDLVAELPLINRLFEHTECKWYEPVDTQESAQ